MAGKGKFIVLAAIAALAFAGRRKDTDDGGGGSAPAFGEITFRQDAVMGAAVNKNPGDSYTISGVFTYKGPANSVLVKGRLYKGSTLIKTVSSSVVVSQTSSFGTYSFSMIGTIPLNLNGDLLDGDAMATEANTGQSVTSSRQSGVYFIPVQEDLGPFGSVVFSQRRLMGRVRRR